MNTATAKNQQGKPNAMANSEKPKTDVAVQASEDYGDDAGSGMEGATAESFAIPFLGVLQKGSPQVDETSGVSIEGAKQGMLFESVSQRMFDGKVGVLFIPCAYRRVFLRWGGKESANSGFKGELLPEAIDQMIADKKIQEMEGRLYAPMDDGHVNEKKSDRFADTRNHYGLLVDEETGQYAQVLLSLTSTQIKKSKGLMALLAGVKVNAGARGMVTPPTWANVVRITTVPESNEKGTWYGTKFVIENRIARDNPLYAAAKSFHDSVVKGSVAANYDQQDGAAASDAQPTAASSAGF